MIDTLAATPDRLRALICGGQAPSPVRTAEGGCPPPSIGEAELSRKPAADVFSLRENVLHLRDIDIDGYEKRVVLILTESNPFLADVDGARLARERDYNNQPLEPALEAFAASRARSIARLRGADLDRTAEFEGVGRVTLSRLLEMWMEHDAGHIADIEALLAGRRGRTTADAA